MSNVSVSSLVSEFVVNNLSNLDLFIEEMNEIVIRLVKMTRKYSTGNRFPFEVLFSQRPISSGSGGWDGGDPMGLYKTTQELIREQTKNGKMYIDGVGNLICEIMTPFKDKKEVFLLET